MDKILLKREKEILSELNLKFVKYLKKGNVFNTIKCLNSKNKYIIVKYLKNKTFKSNLEKEKIILLKCRNKKYFKHFEVFNSNVDFIATYFVNGKTLVSKTDLFELDKNILLLLAKAILEFQNIDIDKIDIKKDRFFFYRQLSKNIIFLCPEFININDFLKIIHIIGRNLFNVHERQKLSHNDLSEENILFNENKLYFLDFASLSPGNFICYDPCFLCLHALDKIENWDWQNRFIYNYLYEMSEEIGQPMNGAWVTQLLRIGLLAAALSHCRLAVEREEPFLKNKSQINKISLVRLLKNSKYKHKLSSIVDIRLHNLKFILNNYKFSKWISLLINDSMKAKH